MGWSLRAKIDKAKGELVDRFGDSRGETTISGANNIEDSLHRKCKNERDDWDSEQARTELMLDEGKNEQYSKTGSESINCAARES